MKYVIKEVNSEYARISPKFSANPGYGFNYTPDLEHATQFTSIAEAIDMIVKRAAVPQGASERRFTIVGVEEVSEPKYREVAL